jgi:hypothetical protein
LVKVTAELSAASTPASVALPLKATVVSAL